MFMGPYLNIDDQSYFCHFGLVAKSWLAGNDKISDFNPSEGDKKTNDCERIQLNKIFRISQEHYFYSGFLKSFHE